MHAAAVPGALGSMGFRLQGAPAMEYLLRQAAETEKVLVLIFLDGGNDGLNTVIPLDRMGELVHLRPKVVLRDSDILRLPGAQVGLHKELFGLKDLYAENRLQIIQNVGYPEQNFSHFRSTDIWMSGSDANTIESTGWMGRQLTEAYPDYPAAYPSDDMQDPLSVEIGYGSSLLFQGNTGSMSVTVDSVNSFYRLLDNVEQDAPDTPAGDKLRFLRLISRQSQEYGQRIVEVAKRVTQHAYYPGDNELAEQLKIVSKLIAGGSRTPVYMVKIGGFDTHDNQVESNHSEGWHAYLLRKVNDAITSFMDDLEFQGVQDKVLGMTFSEFGRTILSNASNGTDHGSAAPLFLFGNALRGGVTGNNPRLDYSMEYHDNLEHEFDFRQVYASVLEQWFGLDTGMRRTILRNDFTTMDIIGDPITIVSSEDPSEQAVAVYPNPLQTEATIRYLSIGGEVTIDLMDINGRSVEKIYRGNPGGGMQALRWSTNHLSRGKYFVIVNNGGKKEVIPVVK